MGLTPKFFNRDFTERIQPSVKLRVNSMRWSAIGGCDLASITAFGERRALAELVEYLRRPVMIFDERGRAVWWGVTYESRYRWGAMESGSSLASMMNRVAVAYSYIDPGTNVTGQRKTTAWAEDASSVAEYGDKEFLSSQDGMTDAGALARRDAFLAAQRYPQTVPGVESFGNPRGTVRRSGAKHSASATLNLVGWWQTLDWQYATVGLTSYINYNGSTSTNVAVGNTSARVKGRQTFTIAANGAQIVRVRFALAKVGSPTDNLVVEVYATDANGDPTGSALASASIGGASLTTGITNYDLTLSAGVQGIVGGVYALQVSRSGAVNSSNYFLVYAFTATGYSGGDWKIWNGSAWAADGSVLDIRFLIYTNNLVETSEQIRDLITVNGEFITGVDVKNASGVYTSSARNGDTTTLPEVEALMKLGTTNARRLLSRVTLARQVEIYEEPAPTVVDYRMDTDGLLWTVGGAPVDPWRPPVGKWVRTNTILPETVDTSRMIDPSLQFVEAIEWSTSGGLRPQFRGKPGVDEMLGMAT